MAISRKTWGARRTNVSRDSRRKREVFIHHEAGPVRKPQSESQERRVMREIQAFHINSRGWADIGYSYVLFPSGRLYEGRGFSALPAAQANHNSGTIAICCAGHYDKQSLTPRQYARLVKACNNLAAKGLRTVGGHYQVFGTACPGRRIKSQLDKLARDTRLSRYHG